MRNSFLFILFLATASMLSAQTTSQVLTKGETVVLGKPSGADYQNIDFPKKNIIIKRGAIPNFNALVGEKLIVENIETDKNGNSKAILKRKDGRKFFRFYQTVEADLSMALENREIVR